MTQSGSDAYRAAIASLFPRAAGGFKLGLETMQALLRELGDPQNDFRSVVVAGTNGKGSAVHAIAWLLERAGFRTGRYTSPHLLRFTERFAIDGQEFTPAEVVELFEAVRRADTARVTRSRADSSTSTRPASFFELGTAIAMLGFARSKVDIAVLEVGLGGRLDATNVVQRELAVITPVGLDHQRYLGNSLAVIAAEKAGIIEASKPLVLAPQHVDADPVIRKIAVEREADVHDVFPLSGEQIDGSQSRPVFLQQAAKTAERVAQVLDIDVPAEFWSSPAWHPPGRYQWLETSPPTLVDAAHNPPALEALVDALKRDPRLDGKPLHSVIAWLNDRPIERAIALLEPRVDSIQIPELATPRAYPSEHVPEGYRAASVRTALEEAAARAQVDEGVVLVAGSFVLLGEALHRLTGAPKDPPVSG